MTEIIAAIKGTNENTRAVIVADYYEEFDKSETKYLENRSSISSVDSSISLSYDALPFTPRSALRDTASPSIATAATNLIAAVYLSSSGNESVSDTDPATNKLSSDEESPFKPPSDEEAKRIVDQIEYYFSDQNIVKDAFLLKHVRRNKEGYVSLKLIASFKRVKYVARDWRAVRHALRYSTELEMNESGTKLRRRHPLPLFDQTTLSRTVVVIHLPAERTTVKSVAEMYRDCGDIASVRILRPENPLPADVHPFYNHHPEVHNLTNALVEFVRTESARNALNLQPPIDTAIRVFEFNTRATIPKKKPPIKKIYHSIAVKHAAECLTGSETEDRYRPPLRSHVMPVIAQQQHHSQQKHNIVEQSYHTQRRWSRDSGLDSSTSGGFRSRSNSATYVPSECRLSAPGWYEHHYATAASSLPQECPTSCVSIPDAFHLRRYSQPRQEPASQFCCGRAGRDRYDTHPLSWRISSGENVNCPHRKDALPEYYAKERRPSSGLAGDTSCGTAARRLSDSDGRLARQRLINNMEKELGHGSDVVLRLPRGPNGGRGFQREIIQFGLPE